MLKELSIINKLQDIELSVAFTNLKTDESFLYNENQQVSSASTIKLLIMASLLKAVEQGKHTLSQRVAINKNAKVEGSILSLLEDNHTYSLKELALLMIIQSDNTATNILIDLLGFGYINNYIATIGLSNTKLQRKMMDFEARQNGLDNLTTATDMLEFMKRLYKRQLLSNEHTEMMLEIMKNQLDRTSLYLEIPDEVVIAHKSGQLDKLQHEVGILYKEQGDIAFAIMTWNADSNHRARKLIGQIAYEIYIN